MPEVRIYFGSDQSILFKICTIYEKFATLLVTQYSVRRDGLKDIMLAIYAIFMMII